MPETFRRVNSFGRTMRIGNRVVLYPLASIRETTIYFSRLRAARWGSRPVLGGFGPANFSLRLNNIDRMTAVSVRKL